MNDRRGTNPICRSIVAATVLTLLIPAARPARAQDNEFQVWTPVYLNLAFNEKLLGWYEVQPRFSNDGVAQLLLRTAVGYRFADKASAWFGYAWTPTLEPSYRTENRIYQQLLMADDFSFGRLTSRTRLEQRWIGSTSGVAVRFRTLLRDQIPVSKDGNWRAVVQDEIFANLNSPRGGPVSGFDQNRFFLGVNRLFDEHLNVDFGYQMQFVNVRGSGVSDQINHILLMQFFFDAAL
jgi:hypothetical protein